MPFGIRAGVRRLLHLEPRSRDAVHEDMDDELRFFLDARIEHLVARGMPEDAARAEAMRRLGTTLTAARQRLHQSAETRERRIHMRERIDDALQDVRYALRGLAHRPAFTAITVATLAVGIGANTAIFGAVNVLLLRPLPFRDPERLMEVRMKRPSDLRARGSDLMPWSYAKYKVFRDAQRSYVDVALWSDETFNVTDGEPERLYGEAITASYLPTLGVQLAAGPGFPRQLDASAGAAPIVILSASLWSRRFNADPAAVGRTISIEGKPYAIVGVLPPTFRGLSGRAELFVPITVRNAEDLSQAWSLEYWLIGRLAPRVSMQQAMSEAATLGRRVYDVYPMRDQAGGGNAESWSAVARPLGDSRVAPAVRRSLLVLFAAVGLVLLIACVNLASLLLGRASTRQREIAVRLAIGAGRARVVRLLLTESVLLSLLGGVASVGVAWWGTHALRAVNPQNVLAAQGLAGLGIVGFSSIRLDVPALMFAFGIALTIGVLFGLAPALQGTRISLQDDLKAGKGPSGPASLRGATGRRFLVVAEVALSLVLLAGAGLMIRSLANRLRVDTGFDSSSVLTLRLNVPSSQVPRDSMPGFYDEMIGRLQAIPGVEEAAIADCPPLSGGCNATIIAFPDRPPAPRGGEQAIGVHVVTPGWFRAMRVPLKRGRLLTDADRLGGQKVIVISESAARKYWPNADPVGTRAALYQGGFQDGATVVGIVGDVRYGTIDSLPVPDAYMSYLQSPRSRMMIFLRTSVDPLSVAASARKVAHDLSPNYPVYESRSMRERVAAATTQARLSAVLLALFAGVALALSIIGIYGVLSFAVVQRTREIGIRMALGAEAGGVLRLVVGEGLAMAAIGVAIGLVAAIALTRVLGSLLYDVSPWDPLTYGSIALLVIAAAGLASWIPARRAARVDPTIALRYE